MLAYVLPQLDEHRQTAAHRASSAAAEQRYAAEKLRWIESLKATPRSHGPVGTVPPMLEVDDDGVEVHVANRSAKATQVAIARVREDAGAPGGWRGCALFDESSGSRYHQVWLPVGARATLRADPRCAEDLAGAPLEYRVGFEANDSEGWWSDSAFTAPSGRELPRAVFESDLHPARRAASASNAPPRGDLLAPQR
jgi:hypothetical protein